MINKFTTQYSSAWLVILTSGLAMLSTLFLDHIWLLEFVDEGHFVESLTLIFYFIVSLFILLYKIGTIQFSYRFSMIFILFAMMAREADLHKIFGMSMLKIKFWLTPAAPISSKILAVMIIVSIAIAIFYIVFNHYKTWYHDLKKKQGYAVSVFIFFVTLIVTKVLDRSLNVINEIIGWEAPQWLIATQQPQEEYLECILPIIIGIAFMQYIKQKYPTE